VCGTQDWILGYGHKGPDNGMHIPHHPDVSIPALEYASFGSVPYSISISTVHCWLHREGFRYMQHKKALYYDGHDCLDVVDYQQNVFLPQMVEYRKWLVSYKVSNVETPNPAQNYVKRALVLLPQDDVIH
jgi:hypothetical protein